MISCPNKSHPDFNKFVNKYGEKKAYLVWNNLYNENIVSTASLNPKIDSNIRKKYFSKSNSIDSSSILEKIGESKHPLNELAMKLIPYAKKVNAIVTLEENLDFIADHASGAFIPESNTIAINETGSFRKGAVEPTIIHEVLHSLTYHKLRENPVMKADLKKLLNHARKNLPDAYALSDVDEFMVALFTNGKFIKDLSKVVPANTIKTKYANALTEVIDFLLKALGLAKSNNAYKQAANIVTNLLEDNQVSTFEKKKFTKNPKELNKTELRSLMSIPYGNVSLQQIINAKDSIKKFNGMFGTSHGLETTKVGESLSYNINFIVNTAPRNEKAFQERQKTRLNPDKFSQGLLFNKESPQKEASNKRQQIIDKTNKRLSKIMTSLGIDVQQQRSLFTEYGNGINGVADLLNKVIKVTDKKYLPEEASHFIMAMLDSSPYKKGLLNLARQSKMYAEVQEEYMRLYNQDENKVAEEVAGKLLAQSFINVEAESLNKENPTLKRRLATLADIIWNWLQKTFSPSIRNEITNIYNELAEQVYAGKINLNPANLLNGGKFFNAESTRNMNKTKVSQGILKKSIARIQNEINILKKQVSKSSLTTNVGYQEKVNLLASLKVKLNDKQYIDGIYNFLNSIKEDMLGTSTPDIESMGSFLDKIGKLNKQIQEGTITNNNAAKQIKELHDHFSSYSPVLKLINSSFNDKTFLKELADADLSPEDINKMRIEVNTLQGQIESLRSDYLAMSKKILTSQYLTYSKQSKEDFVFDEDGNLKFLSLAFKDENGYTRWLTAMAESHDAGLRITDVIVKNAKEKSRLKTLDESKNILNEFDRLSAKGIKLNIIETEKGTPTGYYISDRHRGKFMTAFNKQLAKTKEMKEAGMDSYSIGQEWGTWKQANGTFENPDAGKYTNPAWAKLSGEQQKYLTMLREERSKKLDLLPTGSRSYWMVPQFRKDLVERVRSSNISGAVKVIKDSLLDALVIREDATEFGQVYKDILGKEINFLPLYGNSMLEELGDLSDDITSTTITYNSFATDHIEMQKIIHTIEIAKDVYKERDVLTGNVSEEDYKNLDMEDLLQKYSHTSGEVSKSFERFSTYSEMQVYGKYKERSETSFKFFGKKISVTKAFDVLAKYTALNTLAANIYPIINNVVLGRSLEFMEGIVGEYFDNKHLYSADKELLNPNIIGDIGKKVSKTKVMVYAEYMNVLQDHEKVITDTNTDRKTRLGQIFKNSPWFAGSHMGEFNIQMRTSIGFAKSIKLIDSNGKKTNLYNAFTVKDGKMSLNGKFKVAEANRLFSEKRVGTFINQGDITDFIFQQNNLNQKLHGIYNKLDRNAFQQKSVGGLVMLFRKFLIPAIQRRYKPERFNEMSGQLDEGYYQTFFKFIKMLKTDTDKAAVLFKGTFNSKNLNKEELRQIQNLRRAGLDIGFALALIVFTNLLLDDDDKSDDSWAKSMLAYQAHRLFTEISAFMPAPTIFSEGTKLLASPSAAVSQLESVSSFLNETLNFTRYGEEIEAGQYKGYTRLGKGGTALIPGYKTVKSWFHPDEKVKYFYRN